LKIAKVSPSLGKQSNCTANGTGVHGPKYVLLTFFGHQKRTGSVNGRGWHQMTEMLPEDHVGSFILLGVGLERDLNRFVFWHQLNFETIPMISLGK
jgi:hypothetical protein